MRVRVTVTSPDVRIHSTITTYLVFSDLIDSVFGSLPRSMAQFWWGRGSPLDFTLTDNSDYVYTIAIIHALLDIVTSCTYCIYIAGIVCADLLTTATTSTPWRSSTC